MHPLIKHNVPHMTRRELVIGPGDVEIDDRHGGTKEHFIPVRIEVLAVDIHIQLELYVDRARELSQQLNDRNVLLLLHDVEVIDPGASVSGRGIDRGQ